MVAAHYNSCFNFFQAIIKIRADAVSCIHVTIVLSNQSVDQYQSSAVTRCRIFRLKCTKLSLESLGELTALLRPAPAGGGGGWLPPLKKPPRPWSFGPRYLALRTSIHLLPRPHHLSPLSLKVKLNDFYYSMKTFTICLACLWLWQIEHIQKRALWIIFNSNCIDYKIFCQVHHITPPADRRYELCKLFLITCWKRIVAYIIYFHHHVKIFFLQIATYS